MLCSNVFIRKHLWEFIASRLGSKRGQAPFCEAPCGPFRQRCLTPFLNLVRNLGEGVFSVGGLPSKPSFEV